MCEGKDDLLSSKVTVSTFDTRETAKLRGGCVGRVSEMQARSVTVWSSWLGVSPVVAKCFLLKRLLCGSDMKARSQPLVAISQRR
jgi:hypothetical protein